MRDPAVIGVGVGAADAAGEAAIVVFVDKDKQHAPIPATLDGVKVKVRSVRPFKAFERLACPPEKAAPKLVVMDEHKLKPCR